MNIYYLYEFLRKRDGNVSDYELVKNFRNATSEEIFQAKCLMDDYKKKHPLLADRKCSVKSKIEISLTQNQSFKNMRNKESG